MRISELIHKLQLLESRYGDLECYVEEDSWVPDPYGDDQRYEPLSTLDVTPAVFHDGKIIDYDERARINGFVFPRGYF